MQDTMGQRGQVLRVRHCHSAGRPPGFGLVIDLRARPWVGTPWMAGQCRRGVGVDCTHFVSAVLDELAGVESPTVLPPATQDSMLHAMASEAAVGAFRAVSAVHDLHTVTETDDDGATIVEPGDILVMRVTPGSGPGHVAVVGGRKRTIFHAHRRYGVVEASMPRDDVLHVWRSGMRDRWWGVLSAQQMR